jgi:hypothetical protein
MTYSAVEQLALVLGFELLFFLYQSLILWVEFSSLNFLKTITDHSYLSQRRKHIPF